MNNTEIDTLIQAQISSDGPGVAVAVIKDRQIIHCQGYGLANLEWKLPVTPRTVFGIGSITKQFTATAIMLLERQGKLHLDASIQTYLPAYPTHGHHITLTHLLTHTSGIPNFVTLPGFFEHHAPLEKSIDEVIALFKDLPLDFTPGTRYSYSNSGYILLGYILERLSGMSYADVIQHLIFEPSGMSHSYFMSSAPIIPFRASGYTRTEHGYQHAPTVTATLKHAAGSLGTTLEDMIRWDTTLYEERLLDHATQERIYAPAQLADGNKEDYGLGWVLGHYRGHNVLCHAGGVPGFSALFGRFLDDGVTVIVLSNDGDFNAQGLACQISYLALDRPSPIRTPVLLNSDKLRKIVGSYSEVFGVHKVQEEKQTLYLDSRTTRYTLVPRSETNFYCPDDEDIEVRFENPNEQGIYERIRIIWPFSWFTAERIES